MESTYVNGANKLLALLYVVILSCIQEGLLENLVVKLKGYIHANQTFQQVSIYSISISDSIPINSCMSQAQN